VTLVGAGPGDPELITLKGLKALQSADVVLYDRLIGLELLQYAPADAELLDVGKEPQRQRRSQDEINALLVEKARQGRQVVRLKGGDPFVFGRGGEELLACVWAGIPCEVVPGISSAIAVPARFHIPVTQRGIATQFTVIAGHTQPDNAPFTLPELPHTGTLVFLMGVRQLPNLVQQLLQNGFNPKTPTALIERGTMPNERAIFAELAEIPLYSQEIQPPSVFVVGEVVQFAQTLRHPPPTP
jgi:uroporphyrin-III C-methyltransferase